MLQGMKYTWNTRFSTLWLHLKEERKRVFRKDVRGSKLDKMKVFKGCAQFSFIRCAQVVRSKMDVACGNCTGSKMRYDH